MSGHAVGAWQPPASDPPRISPWSWRSAASHEHQGCAPGTCAALLGWVRLGSAPFQPHCRRVAGSALNMEEAQARNARDFKRFHGK